MRIAEQNSFPNHPQSAEAEWILYRLQQTRL